MNNLQKGSILNKNLVWLVIVQTLAAMAYYAYVPLIPFIEKEFILDKSQIGWMTSAVFLGSSLIAIPSGIITDKIGARRTLFIFCMILAVVTFLFYLSNGYYFILAILFLLGTGYGGITPGTNKGIMNLFQYNIRGTAMGLKHTGVPLGSALGTIILPIVANIAGWRYSLLVVSALIILVCIFHFKMLPKDSIKKVHKSTKWFESIQRIFDNIRFVKILMVIIFFIWVQLSVLTYLVLYLNESILVSLTFSLFCLALLQIGGVVGRVGWGIVSDKLSNHGRGFVLAIIGIASGVLVLSFGLLNESINGLAIGFISFGLGITTQGWNGIFVLMISEVVKHQQIGLASGIGLAVVYIGAILGTPFSGWIVDFSESYKVMWQINGITMVLIGVTIFYLKLDKDEID